MTAVGERTSHIIPGHLGVDPTFRYNPAVIAQAFATMGCLYPGRCSSVGTGEALNEIATGFTGEWPDFKRAVRPAARVGEADARAVVGSASTSTVSTTTSKGLHLRRSRRRRPGLHRRRRAGRRQVRGRAGDGFICTSGKGREALRRQAHAGGAGGRRGGRARPQRHRQDDRDQDLYDPDPELALNNCRFWAPLSLTPEQKHSVSDPMEMERLADELPIEQVARRWIVSSDPDEAVEKVAEYVGYGLNHLVFHAPDTTSAAFGLFQRDLLPRLRKQG